MNYLENTPYDLIYYLFNKLNHSNRFELLIAFDFLSERKYFEAMFRGRHEVILGLIERKEVERIRSLDLVKDPTPEQKEDYILNALYTDHVPMVELILDKFAVDLGGAALNRAFQFYLESGIGSREIISTIIGNKNVDVNSKLNILTYRRLGEIMSEKDALELVKKIKMDLDDMEQILRKYPYKDKSKLLSYFVENYEEFKTNEKYSKTLIKLVIRCPETGNLPESIKLLDILYPYRLKFI